MSKKHHQKIAKIFKKDLTSVAKWCIIILEWESIIIFFIFLPRPHASSSSSSSSSHETPGGVEARRALTFCNLVTFCPYRTYVRQTYVRKKFFKKILENYLFLCYNYVRGGKGAYKKMKRLGALFFIIIIYIAKKFFWKVLKKGCNFLFILI